MDVDEPTLDVERAGDQPGLAAAPSCLNPSCSSMAGTAAPQMGARAASTSAIDAVPAMMPHIRYGEIRFTAASQPESDGSWSSTTAAADCG